MSKQKPLDYETKCKFTFRDDPEKDGEYTIYSDGRCETTCRRCGTTFQVSDNYAKKALQNHQLLEFALCLNCFIEEKQVEKGVEQDLRMEKYGDKDIAIRVGMVANQTAQMICKLAEKDLLKGREGVDEAYDEWFDIFWLKVNEKLKEYNG